MNQNDLRKMINLRHVLHEHPELSMQEAQTGQILMKFLKENTSFETVDRGGWFYAVKRAVRDPADEPDQADRQNREGRPDQADRQGRVDKQSQVGSECPANRRNPVERIAFRADMDALPIRETISLPYASRNPGISHKCGHDGHMAALCGLALELEHYELTKTVYLIFQPGEETGKGALLCKDLLRKENISEIYAFHNLSGYPEGVVCYHPDTTQPASEGLRIKLTGNTSHAAEPEKGCNPAHAISSIVLKARKLTERARDHLLLCTVTGINVGTGDFGISPGDGELCVTLRSDAESEMKQLERQILEYAADLAVKTGLKMEHQICDYFPETRNHSGCLEKVKKAAGRAGIPAVEMDSLWRPSEDFGHYLKECKGAMFYIGNGEKYPPVHTCEYDFNDRISESAVSIFREIALN